VGGLPTRRRSIWDSRNLSRPSATAGQPLQAKMHGSCTREEAYITLHAGGHEIASVGRLRGVERLTIVRRDGREGLELRFVGDKHDLLSLQTRPEIRLHWDVAPLGTR
jgi:hypothetical protein